MGQCYQAQDPGSILSDFRKTDFLLQARRLVKNACGTDRKQRSLQEARFLRRVVRRTCMAPLLWALEARGSAHKWWSGFSQLERRFYSFVLISCRFRPIRVGSRIFTHCPKRTFLHALSRQIVY